MTKLGNYLKRYRSVHGLSLRNFAALSGLSHTYIEKLEKGTDPRSGKPVVPTIDTLQSLSKATGKTLLEILQITGYIPDVTTLKCSNKSSQDPELTASWDELLRRDDLKILLKQVKDLSPKAIHRINIYINMMKKEIRNEE